MTTTTYTRAVDHIIRELNEHFERREEFPRFSDIEDDEGNQYVNLVQEGGGILGVALVGFTYVLEEMGIRFLSLGGTSAGSINALLMADAGKAGEAKSLKVLDSVAGIDFSEFIDGGADARLFIRQFAKGRSLRAAAAFPFNLDELTEDYGINPGTVFEKWLHKNLRHKTWKALRDNITCMDKNLHLVDRNGNRMRALSAEDLDLKLSIVAADVTTQTKVVFPAMAELYYQDPDATSPAEFVRASMSIPLFFEPQRVNMRWALRPENEAAARDRWDTVAAYKGPLPEEALLVDGGVMSNFPIDLLHREGEVPHCPTFGIKLGNDRKHYKASKNVGDFIYNLFEGVRNLRDHEFLVSHPQYKEVVSYIDVEGFEWLDFSVSDTTRLDLFERGARAAATFLRSFNWPQYKRRIRNELLQRVKPLVWELGGAKSLEDKLAAFHIEEDSELYRKVMYLRNREEPYRALWLDDQFTYVLPIAILEELNVHVDIVQHTDDALALINRRNRVGAPAEERYYLVLSDVSRKVRGVKDSIAGINFASDLLTRGLDDLPVIIYAHTRTELLTRLGKYSGTAKPELPRNIKNTDEGDNIRHTHFITEVVNCVYAAALG